MIKKKCFKCNCILSISEFYKHPKTADKHLNKCKICTKWDLKVSNGIHKRICIECGKEFNTTGGELKNGGGLHCSRKCWKIRLPKVIKRESQSPNWKGDKVGVSALHDWVKRQLGKPERCKNCGKLGEISKGRWPNGKWNIDWANTSRKYKRDLKDWIGLCRKCHSIFDKRKLTLRELILWNDSNSIK